MDARIDELMRRGAATSRVIGLAGGLPAVELFPRAALATCFLRVIRSDGCEALQYGWPEGTDKLRGWVADRLRRRGAEIDGDHVIITSGAQQALDLAIGTLFRRGDRIVCDAESYPGAIDLFRAKGIVAVTDDERAAGAYVMPQVSNPHGRTLSADARRALLWRARREKMPILEDDAYADLRFDGATGPSLLADDRRNVWHIGTVSKTLCPGFRVGWLVPPPAQRKIVLERKREADLQASSLSQAIVEDFVTGVDFDRFVARSRRFYARRARRLARALRRELPEWRFEMPAGGFAIWAETDVVGDAASFLERALKKGVSFDPGRSFRVRPSRKIGLRLSFASEPANRIDEGVARLARAWKSFVRQS